ncbi:6-phosphogluconate dehydrogenase C-terminal domain-like protein [Zopfia rhizophila CBS 207.26]|uniref:6-phosphogluconate dehydrogenase C-terminal domain-like protein n=1 Tax=Zopfia rhizophila CBS 207.26 TaxID=1314779 RepID=A0A6A6DCF5_9PEZI|nr:6-phosphogluconate dehydrogenase C-terminal domain-like protein [Zopfia rhizophila CBS 207.26]
MATKEFQNVGILSIGEMGLGIAQVLIAHGYHVYTFAADRSLGTQSRARNAGVELSPTLEHFVSSCCCVLSIVPPRDAHDTAKRILAVTPSSRTQPLYYVDLNAISPHSALETCKLLATNPSIVLIDGGIIGGVPYPLEQDNDWHCPSLIVSGPDKLPDPALIKTLNIRHLDMPIGAATGLKMCFACTTKGFVALAIQSFATAHELGVLDELRAYLERYNPTTLKLAEKGLVTMPPKAYRWVHEMREIAETVSLDGGFEKALFQSVAEVYRMIAEDSLLGKEQPGERVRGETVEDVVGLLSECMREKKMDTNG